MVLRPKLGHLKGSLIGDVCGADVWGRWRCAGYMRYGQGGGLTAEGRDAGSRSGWKRPGDSSQGCRPQ